eukprot:GEMP01031234.1.p1 GENE.GEMP01031234.1~~GEMP01031234.1.p1  ORF type:complete len:408 (+),score=84.78 GEMP01031234.1:168-1391(+)
MKGSVFGHLELAPPDPILDTTKKFKEDPFPRKVNLGVGAYRTEDGKPYVLPVVRKAEELILTELGKSIDKEYAPIDGFPQLKGLTQKLLFGVERKNIASLQAISGTGSLRVAADFICKHLPPSARTIYVSDPTWGNHNAIFKSSGMQVKTYPYWNDVSRSLNFNALVEAFEKMPKQSSVLLHACAHNPTGVDPSPAEWKKIINIVQQRQLIPILDSAYQGYASGDLDKDAFAIRAFLHSGVEFFLCQSFAKNLGLYGERMGMLHIVCGTEEYAQKVLSQAKLVVRPMYSSPPIHGGLLIMKILGDPVLNAQWKSELADMAKRILKVRDLLRKGLEAKGTPGTWNHITDQIGMFSYTGLQPAMCDQLISTHHVYLLKSGRISLAGLNLGNIDYFVNAVDDVVRMRSKI